jgi:hypothetical protein
VEIMTDTNHNQAEAGRRNAESGELDRALDAALAKYAAVEPRAGLEERVLANVRAERARVPDRAWWRWSAAFAVAAVVVVAVALALRSGRPTQPVAVKHTPDTTQSPREPEKRAANGEASSVCPRGHQPIHRPLARPYQPKPAVAAAMPKLDQFPSPQPLSQQELALARYVSEFPQEATLIARAQEEFESEIQQKMKDERSEIEGHGSDQEER